MQNKQQIDLIKLAKFKIQNFPPDSNPSKTNKSEKKCCANMSKERKLLTRKIPLVRRHIKRDWHLLPVQRQQILAYLKQIRAPCISLEKPSHITHYRILFKGIPTPHRRASKIPSWRVFDSPPPSPHMATSFYPWQTAFKWLTYGRREFAASDMWHGN